MLLRRLLERYRARRERPPKRFRSFGSISRKAERRARDPRDRSRLEAQWFRAAVERSNLHWWEPGDPIPTTGRRVLVGVALWDQRNIRILEDLHVVMGSEHLPVDRMDVFDMCRPKGSTPPSWDMLDRYIPGLHKVSTTPIAGLWVDGVLQRKGQGGDAYDLLVEECGIDYPP